MSTATPFQPPVIEFSRKIWNNCSIESILALFTPFVVCLASGDLNIDTFRHFIAQDVHFLRSFIQALQIAEDYADEDHHDQYAIGGVRNDVSLELEEHDSFVHDWGSDLINESPLNPVTTKYADFLLATTSGIIDETITEGGTIVLATPFEKTKIAPYTLGAITPFMRLYASLGKKLKAHLSTDDSNHLYKKWIDKYSSKSFEVLAQRTEYLLDTLSVSLTGAELDIVEKIYLQAIRLEIDFLTAQPLVQKTVIPLCKELKPAEWHLLLFSAFDLTCSQVDSAAILAELSILTAFLKEAENQEIGISSADLRNTWKALSKKYGEEFKQRVSIILASDGAKRFRYKKLCKGLEVLGGFEKKVNARVVKSGVLKGVHLEHINKAGESLILEDGCSTFLQKLVQKEDLHVNVHVLSYGWCGDLIRSAFSSGGLQAVNVHANELIYDESITTGEMTLKVQSPWDKIKAFTNILEGFKDNKKKKLTVYIGDSVGDLLCLLKADIGIVIGSNSNLRKVGNHFGVSFVPLFEGLVSKQKAYSEGSPLNWKGLSGVLYTAHSWADIQGLILGS